MTHVLVIGDIIVDQFIHALEKTDKRENNFPVYSGTSTLSCGGAALAAASSTLVDTSLVGVVGDDIYGTYVREQLHKKGVDDSGIITTCAVDTMLKTRNEGASRRFRVDTGHTTRFPGHIKSRLRHAIRMEDLDAVLISDYQYGVWDALRKKVHFSCPVVVDPGRTRKWSEYPQETTVITPNQDEYSSCARQSYAVVTTRGSAGVHVSTPDGGTLIPGWDAGRKCNDIGAGDVFAMALTALIAKDMPVLQAAARANRIAANYVGGLPTGNEHKRIVFTNGCFDMLHEGHVSLLTKAKAFGEHLIVGLNDDASVARLKGNNRPVVGVDERRIMLESLGCVDEVIVFSEDTPHRLLKMIAPDVLVKGGTTWPIGADIVEAYGGKVVQLPLVGSISTTERIREVKCH